MVNLNRERFCRLWDRCSNVSSTNSDAIFNELNTLYQQPHRHYHGPCHIKDCLSRLDLAAKMYGNLDSVELSIWLHDAIYVTGAADNEQKSAEWFAKKANSILPQQMIAEVEGYINQTTHTEIPSDENSKLVVDVDLSGLGMPWEEYHCDGLKIRKEFAHLSDDEFFPKQNKFLQSLLDRDRLFLTDFFYQMCEAQARKNIRKTLGYSD